MTGLNIAPASTDSNQPSSSSANYASRHQERYKERIRKESEMEMIEADEALARSLQQMENNKIADRSLASEIHESIQHPPNLEDGVRAPLRTGYTERLIGDDTDDRANTVRNPSRIWSMFSRRAISGSSESLLPPATSDSGPLGDRILAVWAPFVKFVRTYLAVIVPLLVIVVILGYILYQSD